MDIYTNLLNRAFDWLRKFFIITYNIYGWYWLYKIIFVLEQDWENYALWFFAMTAQVFFVLEGKEKVDIREYIERKK